MKHPAWSCYPEGVEPSRRAFLRAVAAAAAASSLAAPQRVFAQKEVEGGPNVGEGVPDDIPTAYPEGAVRINFNENPIGPSPKAIEAVVKHDFQGSNRYNNITPLTEAIAEHHGVSPKEVLVGCGSTEFLNIAPWTFLGDGGSMLLHDPAYGWSAKVAKSMGAKVVKVPLAPQGSMDARALRKAYNVETRFVYVANPNNPTGSTLPYEDVSLLAEALPRKAVLVVDEAYNVFLPPGKTAVDLVRDGAPVVALRTFSKAYGLAGLRLGYALAPEALIKKLETYWMLDLSINAAAAAAGPAALQDREHVDRYVRTITEAVKMLRAGAKALDLESYPHVAPFLMIDLGREAAPVLKALRKKKVYVTDGKSWGKPTFLRVSVGLAADNQAFLKTLGEVLTAHS
jgi:histidinol-phosphate aminotransferase